VHVVIIWRRWPLRLSTLVCQLPVWAGDSTDSCISSELGISTAMQRFVFWTLTLSLGNGLLQWALKHPGKEELRRGMAWSRVNAQVSVSVWFGSPWAHNAQGLHQTHRAPGSGTAHRLAVQ